MAIAAKRFTMLNNETNVGTATFGAGVDSSVMNSPINALPATTESLDSLINSAIQSANGVKPQVTATDALADVTRYSKDVTSRLTDLSKLPAAATTEFFKEIAGGDAAMAKTLQNLAKTCSSGSGFGYGVPGRPQDATLNCGNGDISVDGSRNGTGSSCNASSYSDLLSKLTGGQYSSLFKDINSVLKAFMAIAGYGYKLGMCGIFSALSGSQNGIFSTLSNNDLSKASGSLLSILGTGGNTNGFLDVAGASAGLTPLFSNPSGIGDFLNNFTAPANTKNAGLTTLADRSLGGVELLNDQWYAGSSASSISIGETTCYRDDLGKAFDAKLTNRSFNTSSLDTLANSDTDFLMGSYLMQA